MKKSILILCLCLSGLVLKAQSDYPPAVVGHTLNMIEDTIYMFGGMEIGKNNRSLLANSVYKFQPSNKR